VGHWQDICQNFQKGAFTGAVSATDAQRFTAP